MWAVVGDKPRDVVAHGRIQPPRSYDEGTALRHLHEGIVAAVRENSVTDTVVWTIETNARMNNSMRPRLRAEGAACAAAASCGSAVALVIWSEVASRASAEGAKADYENAAEVCGVEVGEADSRAVLAAIAAMEG